VQTDPIFKELKPVSLPIESIFLDPNNPRFYGTDWQFVADERITDPLVQAEVQQRLTKLGLEGLQMSIEANGYLPIDRVVVREFGPQQYVVLEGNRRICATKQIIEAQRSGATVSKEVFESLRKIPTLQYTGSDEDAAWIFQGIRHITSIREWSSYSKAKLLVDEMTEHSLSLSAVGKRFGLTPHGAGQWVRGYKAFMQAKEASDYIKEVDERAYPYFQELFSRSSVAVREWMEWNEPEHRFDNALKFNEFVGWLYPKPRDENEDRADALGEWDRRFITRQDDIRQLAFLIREAPESFEQFRQDGQLEKAYSLAQAKKYRDQIAAHENREAEVIFAIEAATREIEDIPYKMLRNKGTKDRLKEKIDTLMAAIKDLGL
jgi:hypothetical protein